MHPLLTASARLGARAGAVFLSLCIACERVQPTRDEGPRVLELAHDTIELKDGVSLVQIDIERSGSGEFQPAPAQARQGDVVRFTAQDRAAHAIVFAATSLDPSIREYLERTAQLRSPPLITAGSAWVITLDGAPPGEYPFRCTTHDAAGRLVVTPRS